METNYIWLAFAIASYPIAMAVRWYNSRSLARAAIDRLESETNLARERRGDLYRIEFRYPELMDQIVHEISDLRLALVGTMILTTVIPLKVRLSWRGTSDFRDVMEQVDRGIQELNNAAFFAQFPKGAAVLENVVLNGIPIRER